MWRKIDEALTCAGRTDRVATCAKHVKKISPVLGVVLFRYDHLPRV